VAVTVADEAQWRALTAVLDRADWATDPTLDDAAGRRARHDALDAGLTAWLATRDAAAAAAALTRVGIPAARVLTVPAMFDDPQLVARGYYVELDHPRTGRRRYPGWPTRFSTTSLQHRRGAPTLGQHNDEVLGVELGLDEEARDALRAAGVIGDRLG
jgi:crotonobetainyl-CoA:carnitine CoA-transferase CaiB-like acyl-CoA transferase